MNKEKKGELLVLIHSVFESWFPIIAGLAVAGIGAIYAYAWTVFFSTITFLIIVVFKNELPRLFFFYQFPDLILASFFITLMFSLIFIGLKYTSAGNAAVIIFMQFFFSYVYFNLLGKESLPGLHIFGALLMIGGAITIIWPDNLKVNHGDLIILAASGIAPIANFYQKKARQNVSAATLLCFRNIAALPFLFLLAYSFEQTPDWDSLNPVLIYLLINGVLLMGVSKWLWIETIYRISITKASAMIALTPFFTLLFAYWVLDELPELWQIFGAVLIISGTYLITRTPQSEYIRTVK